MTTPTLYDAIGGRPALELAVPKFYAKILGDAVLAPFFAEVDMDRQRALQIDYLEKILSGPDNYKGRDMVSAHAAYSIEPRHFARVAGYLESTLVELGVDHDVVQTIIGAVAKLAPAVCNTPDKLNALVEAARPHAAEVKSHPLYSSLKTIEHVRTFMEYHVYAVWDFMCLLKALQSAVTCTTVPWVPTGDAETRRLINEIVVGEESDKLSNGAVVSHFELYVDAMKAAGANTGPVLEFVEMIREGHLVQVALSKAHVPKPAQAFVLNTMDIVNVGRPHAIAAAFTIGREELIPDMFLHIVDGVPTPEGWDLSLLVDYLQRHIELDGGEHGPLAMRMLENLCRNDAAKWNESIGAAIGALRARHTLWTAVHERVTR